MPLFFRSKKVRAFSNKGHIREPPTLVWVGGSSSAGSMQIYLHAWGFEARSVVRRAIGEEHREGSLKPKRRKPLKVEGKSSPAHKIMQTEIEAKFLGIKPDAIRGDLKKNKAVLVHSERRMKRKTFSRIASG